MSIARTIEEQSSFGFTGRINILLEANNQFVGAVLLLDGTIIDAQFDGISGEKALYAMVYKDITNQDMFSYVVEPEIIESNLVKFQLTMEIFKKKASVAIKRFREAEKYRPPAHLKLIVNGDFIKKGADVTDEEFKVLSVISEYSKVDEIYKYSKLQDFEVTEALITLKRKNALRVFNT